MIVVGTIPSSVSGANNIGIGINAEDQTIAPGHKFGYYTYGFSGDHYVYVVLDKNGDGFYNASDSMMNVSVSTSANSFNDHFSASKTSGLDGTYDVYAIDDNSLGDGKLNLGDSLTNGSSTQINIDGSPPWISDVNLTNPTGQTLNLSITTNEQLNNTTVNITGPESKTLHGSDFTEVNDSGTYTYNATVATSSDGDYTAQITEAQDDIGNDAANNQSVGELNDTVTVDTVPPGLKHVEAEVGNATAVVTFNESVVGGSGNALSAGDFVFTNANAGGATSISSVSHTAGSKTAIVTFDAPVTPDDLGNDTIAANASHIYDEHGNAAGTAAKALADAIPPGAPTGISAPAINLNNQGKYNVSVTLPDDHEAGTLQLSLAGGVVTDSTTVTSESDGDSKGDTVNFTGLDVSGIADGSVSIDATFTDYGGNSSSASGISVTKDTGRPSVTGASISNAPIGTYDAGNQQTVTVDFNESVNTSVSPTVRITNLNRTYTVNGSFDDATTWTGTVTITDDNEQATGKINITGVTDHVGNVMVADSSNTFQVDTTGPAKPDSTDATNITRANQGDYNVTVNLVSDSQADTVSVKISDGTNTVIANKSFTPGTDPVTVSGIDVSGLDDTKTITVTALALDGGYPNSEGYTAGTMVTKDTARPNATAIAIGDGEINDTDAGTSQPVTVTFDEPMNQSVNPSVQVADLNRTFTVSGSYDNATTWTGTVVIMDDNETTTGNVTVSGAVDAVGNQLSLTKGNFSVDTVTPSITGFDLRHTGGGTVEVSFNASESLDAESVSLSTPSGSTTLTSFTKSGSGPYEYTATYTGSDGTYTATLDTAQDGAGNDGATAQTDSVTVDTTPPTFSNSTPADTTVTDNTSTMTIDIADTTGSVAGSSIHVTVTDASGTELNAVGTAHSGVSFDGSTLTIDPSTAGITLADGDVNVSVAANDTAGNPNTTQFSFTVDTVAPTFSNATPTGMVTDNSTAIHVDIADATAGVDGSSLQVTLSNTSGQFFTGGTGTNGISFDGSTLTIDPTKSGVPTLPNGTVTVEVTADDVVGNERSTSFSFGVDVPPWISDFTATNTAGMDVDVSFNSTDTLDTVSVGVSGAESGTLTTSDFSATPDGHGGYVYTATYTGSTDGTDTFALNTASDGRSDGATGQTKSVLVDETPPAVTVSTPDGGELFRDGETTTIGWTATDSVSVDTVSIDYSTDGGGSWTAITASTANDGTYDWTVPAIDSTSVLVRVNATDTSGNVGTDTSNSSFTIDSTAPTVGNYSVSNPSGQNIVVSFDTDERLGAITAAVSGTESGTLTMSDFTETDNGDGTYTYTATYAGSSDGTYTASLNQATDAAGNDGASSQSQSATVDTTNPSISNFGVTNPSGQNVTVTLDSNELLGTLEVNLSGAANATLTRTDFTKTGTTYSATYNGSTDGNYTATLVVAADGAGNDGASGETDAVSIDTTPPTISNVTVSNPTQQEVQLRFDSSEPLATVSIAISGAETATVSRTNPTKVGGSYVVTYTGHVDGTYTATLTQALDDAGNDGAHAQSGSVTVDAQSPTISNVTASNPSGKEIRIRVVSSERLSAIETDISGPENVTLTLDDFTRNGTTYTANYTDASNGTYDVTVVTFADTADNAGSAGQTDNVTILASAPTASHFVATNPTGRQVNISFDSSEPLSDINVSLFGAETTRLRRANFTENGTTYTATYNGSVDGTYTATLDRITDGMGTNSLPGMTASVTINTSQSGGGTGGGNTGSGTGGGNTGSGTGGGNTGSAGHGTGNGSNDGTTHSGTHDPLSVTVTPTESGSVNVSVKNADAHQQVGMAFGNTIGTSGLNVSQLNLTAERRADYKLRVNSSANLSTKSPDFDGHTVGFAEIDHSIPDSDIEGVEFTFRVDAKRFETAGLDPGDAMVYRYHDGRWNALETSVVGRDGNSYILQADSPGLSMYTVGLRNTDLLSVSGASLSGPSETVGHPITVSATVTNRGNWTADEKVAVTANGSTVATRFVTVPAGKTKTVSFDITLNRVGTYNLAVDGTSAGTLVLSDTSRTTNGTTDKNTTTTTTGGTAAETTTDVTTDGPSTASSSTRTTDGTTHKTTGDDSTKPNHGSNNWLFAVAGMLVLAGAVFLVVRRW